MRVVIVNQHTENLGDEAAGAALAHLIFRNPDVGGVDFIYNGPGHLPLADVRARRVEGAELSEIGRINIACALLFRRFTGAGSGGRALKRFSRAIADADLVLVAPCGANLGIYRDWRFLVRLLLALRMGATPVFHFNTIGASGNWLFDRAALRVLSASHVFVRERASADYLREIGIESALGPDTAFALPPVDVAVREDVLSLVPSELDSWHPNFRTVSGNRALLAVACPQISQFARTHGLRIEILPHLGSAEELEFNKHVLDALVNAGFPPSAVQILPRFPSFLEYDAALASSRLVVGGRYHSIVLSAKNARPFVALSYENKMAEVCIYTGMPGSLVDLRNLESVAELGVVLQDVYARSEAISGDLRDVVARHLRPATEVPLRELGLLID